MSPRVAVVGGGLAGIAAALRCADAGCEVTLFEARPKLGGLTHSFQRGELSVDNGQHVFLRCCTAYLALLDRLGVADQVTMQPRLDIPVRSAVQGRTARLRRNRLPAPLHLADSILRYSPLSVAERLRFGRAALALRRLDRTDPAADRQTFGAWLAAHGQSQRAVDNLWDLVGIATLNAPAHQASLALAAMVFQVGMLTDCTAADIGWSLVPLQQLHGDAAMECLAKAGAQVLTGTKIRALSRVGDGWRVAADDGGLARRTGGRSAQTAVEVDQVVLAVPPAAAQRLLPPGAVDLPEGWAARLGTAPIVNAHVVYDRRVLDEPFLAGVDTPAQWVFDRTVQSGLTEGQYVAVSLSAADAIVDTPAAQIRDLIVPALARLLPEAGRARIRDFFVTRERHATFRPTPGTASLRPPTRTALPGLFLAGAWTATGWPATMEGAVRSGEAAAAAVLDTTASLERAST
ncbi:MAG: FAD-dependent oxidoreductase [Micromonosporaceae bacterium]|nr:FAD-dependent oxidoreductase [Micromonosporaceae bacterium]